MLGAKSCPLLLPVVARISWLLLGRGRQTFLLGSARLRVLTEFSHFSPEQCCAVPHFPLSADKGLRSEVAISVLSAQLARGLDVGMGPALWLKEVDMPDSFHHSKSLS